jgi:hypothetical protein
MIELYFSNTVRVTKTILATLAFLTWVELSRQDGKLTTREFIKSVLLFVVILGEAL